MKTVSLPSWKRVILISGVGGLLVGLGLVVRCAAQAQASQISPSASARVEVVSSLPASPYLVAGLPDPRFEPKARRVPEPPASVRIAQFLQWLFPFLTLGLILIGLLTCHLLLQLIHRCNALVKRIPRTVSMPVTPLKFVDENGEVVWYLSPHDLSAGPV